jgi:hypothetical protein
VMNCRVGVYGWVEVRAVPVARKGCITGKMGACGGLLCATYAEV